MGFYLRTNSKRSCWRPHHNWIGCWLGPSVCIGLWFAWLPLIVLAQAGDQNAEQSSVQGRAVESAELPEELQKQFPRVLFDVSSAIQAMPPNRLQRIDSSIIQAYQDSISAGSSDFVLTQQKYRDAFVAKSIEILSQRDPSWVINSDSKSLLCWRLLGLRKAGKLPRVEKRAAPFNPTAEQLMCGEIASRRCEEWYEASLDRVLVDQQGRSFFQQIVREMNPKADLDSIRRAALTLRKSRRLRPELSAKLIDWEITQLTFAAQTVKADLELVPKSPGIYLFRDATGYLYIGEAINLHRRLADHLNDSDRKSLADYLQQEDLQGIQIDLHVFPNQSPGKSLQVRRAYESELIRSRNPRFNIRP